MPRKILIRALWFAVVILSIEGTRTEAQSLSHEQLRDQARILAVHVDGLFKQVDITLMAVADLIERDPDAEEIVIHGALKRYADQVEGVRAIIVTDGDGRLQYDSFMYPAIQGLDLSDRSYIEATLATDNRRLIVSPKIVGRTSGFPFVPLSRVIRDVDGQNKGVVVAVMWPRTLLKVVEYCNGCFANVSLVDGTVLASSPENVTPSGQLIKLIQEDEENQGIVTSRMNQFQTQIAWVRSKQYGIFVAYSELL